MAWSSATLELHNGFQISLMQRIYLHGETSQPKEDAGLLDLWEVGIGINSEAYYTILGYSSVVIEQIASLPRAGLIPPAYRQFWASENG